jgi:large subunit ribosomal protein L21
MYAIIQESGSQRRVSEGDVVLVDLVDGGEAAAGLQISFDKVLLVGGDASAKVGRPYVAGASVTGEVVDAMVLGEKLAVQKFRTKKAFKKRTGHRQRYTRVKITGIKG